MILFKERFQLWLAGIPVYIKRLILFGLLLGVLNAIYLYVMVLTPLGTVPYIGYSKLLFIAIDIYFLVKVLKGSKDAEKKYIDQVIVGTIMFGVGGLLFAGAVFVLTQWIKPNLLQEQRESVAKAIVELPDRSDEDKQKLREQYERQLQQPQFSLDQFTGMTSNGLLYALVVSIFIRHKEIKEKGISKKE